MLRLSEILRQRRALLGLSQTQLGALAAVSLPTVQNIEGDRANPAIGTVESLLAALGLRIAWVQADTNWPGLAATALNLVVEDSMTLTLAKDIFLVTVKLAVLDAMRTEGDAVAPALRQALAALLTALRIHYPVVYAESLGKTPAVKQFLEQEVVVRIPPSIVRRLAEVM